MKELEKLTNIQNQNNTLQREQEEKRQNVHDLSRKQLHIEKNIHIQLRKNIAVLSQDTEWLKKMCKVSEKEMNIMVNTQLLSIADILYKKYRLNDREIRFCVLVLFGYDRKQIAEHLSYSPKSIGKTKNIIARKIGINSGEMQDYLFSLIENGTDLPSSR